MAAFITGITLLVVAVIVLVGGICGWIAVTFFYERARPWLTDTFAKEAISAVRFLTAGAGIMARFQLPSDPAFQESSQTIGNAALAVAIVAWLAWESLQHVVEKRMKTDAKQVASELRDSLLVERELLRLNDIYATVIRYLRIVVNEKTQRLTRAIRSQAPKKPADRLAKALTPEQQMIRLLGFLALSLERLDQRVLSAERNLAVNFRIGLYVPRNGSMIPWLGFNALDGKYDPFSSYEKHPERFQLDNLNDPAHTVRCVREKRTIIIPDTVAANIAFFNDEQPNYLKSFVAHPFSGLHVDGKSVEAAIVIDANFAGYFREADRTVIEFLLQEFAARLVLESGLLPFCPVGAK